MLRTNRIGRLAPGTALGALLALVALGCGEAQVGVTVQDVLDEPDRYVGKAITVQGEVAETHGPHWFTIDAPGVLDDEMLVFSRDPYEAFEGREVAVSGEVQMLVVSELETEYGVDLDPELEIEFSDRPILIAGAIVGS